MKKWLKKHKLRLIISLAMIIAAVVLGFSLDGFTGPESEMSQRMIFITFVVGTVLSALCGAGFGLWGFVGGYAFVLVLTLPHALPEPFNRYFFVIYLAAVLGLPCLKLRKNRNKKSVSFEEKDVDDEESAEYEPLDLPTEFILCNNPYSGRWYQLIRRSGFIYAYFIGGGVKTFNVSLVQKLDSPLRPLGKKDFSFSIDDISRIKVKDLSAGGMYSHVAIIKTKDRSYRFWEVSTEGDCFLKFWQALSPSDVLDKGSREDRSESTPDKKRHELAGKLKLAYGVYLGAVSLAWLFLDVPYSLFAVLNMLAFPMFLALYFLFPGELTLLEAKSKTKKHSVAILAVMSGFSLLLRLLLDFNILNWGRLFAVAAVLAVLILLLFLMLSKEWKRRKAVFAYLAIALLMYSMGAAMQLNVLLDYSEPEVVEAVIERMHISAGSRSPDSYIIEVIKSDGSTQELEISESQYEALSIGDSVEVYTYPGCFGIEYAKAR